MGSLEQRPRPEPAARDEPAVRESRRVRHRRHGSVWPVGAGSYLRHGVGAASGSRLGPVSRGPLGMDGLLRLDLGQLRDLGLGDVSLWAMVSEPGLRLVAGFTGGVSR